MRIEYPDADLFWADAVATILRAGTDFKYEDVDSKELFGISFTLTDIRKNFIINDTLKLNATLLSKDFFEIFEDNSRELSDVITQLNRCKYTRKIKKLISSVLEMQFIVSDNKLHTINSVMSGELFRDIPATIFLMSTLHRVMADALELDYGWCTFNIGCLYIDKYNQDKIKTGFELGLHAGNIHAVAEKVNKDVAIRLLLDENSYNYNPNIHVDEEFHALREFENTYVADLIYLIEHGYTEGDNTYEDKIINKNLVIRTYLNDN